MVNFIKELLKVNVHYPFMSFLNVLSCPFHCLVGAPFGPESVACI